MSEYYLVRDVGAGLDGLLIEGVVYEDKPDVAMVTRILSRDMFVGDRNLSIPVAPSSLFVSLKNLERVPDPGPVEFAHDNPYGDLLAEGKMTVGSVSIAYGKFENALTINVYDEAAQRTLYSQNFGKQYAAVLQEIENIMRDSDGSDIDDVVFKLRELKEKETHG